MDINIILHITSKAEWEQAKHLGVYRSKTLATEGFIHCSMVEQVIGSANRFFADQKDLVILEIDLDRVIPPVWSEGVDRDNLFPHIYGELNLDAVIRSIDLEADDTGLFILPIELVNN